MCNEARGLSGWPRTVARWGTLVLAITAALAFFGAGQPRPAWGDDNGDDPEPPPLASVDEPVSPAVSLKSAASYLDTVALNWTRERKCGTCHTNFAYLISRPSWKGDAASPAHSEIRSFFEDRVNHWDDAEKAAKPRFDAEVVATAAALALNDASATGKLQPVTRKALDRIWTLQKSDGSWEWLKCDWPPLEHDDYYGAAFAAVGVGSAPDGYAKSESARKGLDRLRSYLKATPAPDLHHQTILLWASTKLEGLLTEPEREATVKALRDLQRPDGGWSLPSLGRWSRHDGTANPEDAPSDGYGTGLVVYVLRQTGVPATDPSLKRAVDWLKTHQRTSGRWFTRSLSTDKYHYISNAGSGFALMALTACGEASP